MASERIPKCAFPSTGLRYPKSNEMPIFQTFDQVLAQTENLDPESNEAMDLWGSVFLNRDEIGELLDHIETKARHAFIYPMFVLAAHTGARRGEILRSQVNDIGSSTIAIRERKRKKRINSMRHVPMSSGLKKAMADWLKSKPKAKRHSATLKDLDANTLRGQQSRLTKATIIFEPASKEVDSATSVDGTPFDIRFAAIVQLKESTNESLMNGSDIRRKKCVDDTDTCSQIINSKP